MANVDNPVVRNTYANIPVTIVNEDVITQGGEVYSVLDEQNVNVVVYAKRSVIQQISSDEIVATADIKEMDAHTGLIPIKITIPSHSGEYQSAEALFLKNFHIHGNSLTSKVITQLALTDDVLCRIIKHQFCLYFRIF